MECDLYGIFDVTDKPKKYFETQKVVEFKKIWFFHDYILQTKRKPDMEYLSLVEKKYNLSLWLIASNDRFFNHFI